MMESNECIAWFDFGSEEWVVASDCGAGYSCPVGILNPSSGPMPGPGSSGGSSGPSAILPSSRLVSPAVSMSVILTCVSDSKTAVFYPFSFSVEKGEVSPLRNSFGLINWTDRWMRQKFDSTYQCVGCELQRTGSVSNTTQLPVGSFSTNDFVSPMNTKNRSRNEINVFVFSGHVTKPKKPKYTDCEVAGVGTFCQFESPSGSGSQDKKWATTALPYILDPLFVFKRDREEDDWNQLYGDEAYPVGQAVTEAFIENLTSKLDEA